MHNATYNIRKIFKNKKAINDLSILGILLSIFIGVGIIIPFVNSEFQTVSPTFDTDKRGTELIVEDLTDVSSVGAGDILKSIGKMFFWTFGDLPFWLDAIFLVLRLILLALLIRNFVPFLGGGW